MLGFEDTNRIIAFAKNPENRETIKDMVGGTEASLELFYKQLEANPMNPWVFGILVCLSVSIIVKRLPL